MMIADAEEWKPNYGRVSSSFSSNNIGSHPSWSHDETHHQGADVCAPLWQAIIMTHGKGSYIHKDEELVPKCKLPHPYFHKLTLLWEPPYVLPSLYYLTATKTTLQAILLFMIIFFEHIILRGTHYTKKADPIYPFPGRVREGNMQHADESLSLFPVDIFIPISNRHINYTCSEKKIPFTHSTCSP